MNKLPSSPYDAYQQGRKEREAEIIEIVHRFVCDDKKCTDSICNEMRNLLSLIKEKEQ